jgi:hypothetical protein
MEVYRDNTIKPGCAFAVNADGKVAARLEGAYSKSELENAVKAATGG